MELPQPTIGRIVFRVTALLATHLNTYIKFMTNQAAIEENRRLFKELGYGHGAIGLPCIDGAIDCTHIRLLGNNFGRLGEIYRNRKGYHSLNMQVNYKNNVYCKHICPCFCMLFFFMCVRLL